MPQILLAAQVLDPADDAGLHSLCRQLLHSHRRWPGELLDAFPESLADRLTGIDEG